MPGGRRAMSLMTDFKFALRSLARAKGLALTVVVTLALGIGANAAIFSVVRGVLLRPLVNRDADRLIYIRQSAPGIGVRERELLGPRAQGPAGRREDAQRVRRLLDHRVHDARPRRAAHGARGRRRRLLLRRDGAAAGDGPAARSARRRPEGARARRCSPIASGRARSRAIRQSSARTITAERSARHDRRRPRAVGAVSAGNRDHRQRRHEPASSRRDDGRGTRASDDGALRPARAWRRPRQRRARSFAPCTRAMVKAHPEAYQTQADFRIDARNLRDQIISPARTILLVLLAASGARLHRRLFERRESDSGAIGAPRRRAGRARGARRRARARCGGRCSPRACCSAAPARCSRSRSRGRWWPCWRATPRASRCARNDVTVDASLLWVGVGARGRRRRAAGVRAAPAVGGRRQRHGPRRAAACASRRARTAGCACSRSRRSRRRSCCVAGAGMLVTTLFALQRQQTGFTRQRAGGERAGRVLHAEAGGGQPRSTRKRSAASRSCRASSRWRSARSCRGAIPASSPRSSRSRATARPTAKRIRARGSGRCRRDSSRRSAFGLIAGRDFNDGDRRDGEQGRHHQRERRAADVPEHGRRQSPADVDRSGHEVHRREHRSAAHRRRRRRHGRREPGAGADDDGVSPDGAGDERRPALRPREAGSVRARAGGHEGDSRAGEPISRWSARRRSTTSARRCWRRIASTRSCSAGSPASRC